MYIYIYIHSIYITYVYICIYILCMYIYYNIYLANSKYYSLFYRYKCLKSVLIKNFSENMQHSYRRRPMPKCGFNKIAKQRY